MQHSWQEECMQEPKKPLHQSRCGEGKERQRSGRRFCIPSPMRKAASNHTCVAWSASGHDNVMVRTAPPESNIISSVLNGTPLSVLHEQDEWFMVRTDLMQGWIEKRNVQRLEASEDHDGDENSLATGGDENLDMPSWDITAADAPWSHFFNSHALW